MKDTKLRVGFARKNGVVFVKGDHIKHLNAGLVLGDSMHDSINNGTHENWEVVAFAPRKNEGVRPVGYKYCIVTLVNGEERRAEDVWFDLIDKNIAPDCRVSTWKPDLDSLIKMQVEHDSKSKNVAIDEHDWYAKEMKNTKVQIDPDGEIARFLNANSNAASEHDAKQVKPHTRVEYVKLTHPNQLFDFADVLFFKVSSGNFISTKNHTFRNVMDHFSNESLYSKVETEITWQDDVFDIYGLHQSGNIITMKGGLSEKNFVDMCHLVASMTDNK